MRRILARLLGLERLAVEHPELFVPEAAGRAVREHINYLIAEGNL